MYRVLIIDDEPVTHEYISSLVPWEKEGLKLCPPAYNGQDARRLMSEAPADIVLLDMFMPGENGVNLSRYIRDKYPGTVILAISSHDDYDYVRELLKNGAYDYILKHRLNEESLLAALRGIIAGFNGQGAVPESRTVKHQQIHQPGPMKTPPRPGSPVLGMGITLSVSRRKILNSLLEEGNRAGTELIIRNIFSSIKNEAGMLGAVHDLGKLLTDYLQEKGISADFSGLDEWTHEKSVVEIEQKMLEMLREFSDEAQSGDSHIRQVRGYLLDHFSENINLENAAANLNLSPSYLSRLYRKETGVSFIEDLNRIRVDAAKACLLEGINLKSTAARCGFRYYNYFIKVFQDYAGLTPTEYIKNL